MFKIVDFQEVGVFLWICRFGYLWIWKIRQFVNLSICKSFLTPPEKLPFFSSPCKGDRNTPNLVQSSPLFKGSTCEAGEGLEPIKNFELRMNNICVPKLLTPN